LDYFIISTKLFDYVEDCTVFSDEDMTSDHFPISLKLKLNRNISKKNIYQHFTKFKKYNFEKANWDGFKNALPTAVDSNIGDNVDELEEFIKHSLLKASDQFIPIFTNKANKSKQLPKHILDLIKARKTARKIADKDPDCKSAKKLYNKLTETIREENRAARDKEWSNFVDKLGINPPSTKPFWKRINIIKGKKNKQSIPTLKVDGVEYESDDQKANLFASILNKTFLQATDNHFNYKFKKQVEDNLNNFDFNTQDENNKDIFDLREINLEVKNLIKT
jgi:hypothetical protein